MGRPGAEGVKEPGAGAGARAKGADGAGRWHRSGDTHGGGLLLLSPLLFLYLTTDDLTLAADFSDVPEAQGRIVAGFDVGRTRDRSELAVFDDVGGRFTCRLLRSYAEAPFAEQEADLRRLFEVLPVARLSIGAASA